MTTNAEALAATLEGLPKALDCCAAAEELRRLSAVEAEAQAMLASLAERREEYQRLLQDYADLKADAERLKEHAVTLANTTFLATLERCAQLCESHFNHEAKDCADEIRALKDHP